MVALFNDAWLRLNGYGGKSEAELDEMKANAPKAYGVSFVCNAVMAAAMTVLAEYMVLDTGCSGAEAGGTRVWRFRRVGRSDQQLFIPTCPSAPGSSMVPTSSSTSC